MEQSLIDNVKEVERNKVFRAVREEDLYVDGFLDGVESEAFKSTMDQEVEEVFQSSQDSLNLDTNVYPSSPLSVLPPSTPKKKTVKPLPK